MKRLLLLLVLLLISTLIGVQLSHDPGYVLIAINHWTIETSVWIALLLSTLCFILLYGLLRSLSILSQWPTTFKKWRLRRRLVNAQHQTQQGFIQFSEGYWSDAKSHLLKALPNTDSPLLNYLTLARAAQEMGDSTLRDQYLREAQRSMPDAKVAVELTQAQLQLANKQWEQALATLRHLQDLVPHHPYVLKQLMYLYQEVKDWQSLLMLIPELTRFKVISKQQRQVLENESYLQTVIELSKQIQSDTLDTFMNQIPKSIIYQQPLIIKEYAQFLIKNQRTDEAELLLYTHLKKQYSEALITLYSEFAHHPNALTFSENFLKKMSPNPCLYLALARISIHQKLWGKAKDYIEKSLLMKESPEAYILLGDLSETLGDTEKAKNTYKLGLRLAHTHQN